MTEPTTLRRVIAQQWVSVDGFASGAVDESEIFAAMTDFTDSERHNQRLLTEVDAVLLGRRTYETFVRFWPTATGQPMAELVNRIPKLVCSTTLTEAPWGDHPPAEVVADAESRVRRLRAEPGGRILLWGSLALMHALLSAGLVDEVELLVAPVVLGRGTPAMPPGRAIPLVLIDGEVWPSGAARLRYAVESVDTSTANSGRGDILGV